jgi:HEAT repeat protein
MSTIYPLLLSLGILMPDADSSPVPPADPAHLKEMLQDRQHPLSQSQAALLLVQSRSSAAVEMVQRGLRQTDSPEVFLALAGAIRLQRDTRFMDEFLAALTGGQPAIRQSTAETLAELADPKIILRLQGLVEDSKVELAVRQAAVWALGRSGRRAAAVVLLDQLSSNEEAIRQSAAEALAELTGRDYQLDINRWRMWWQRHKDISDERWLEERLAFHTARSRRLEGELERAKAQNVHLQQQLYNRLPAGDRLAHVQTLVDSEEPAVRALAVSWSTELLATADAIGQRALADLLLRFSHDGSLEVQRAAVLALGRVNDPRAFDRLRVLLQRGQTPSRAAAARAFAQQVKGSSPEASARQRQVIRALQKALDDPALEVVVEAAESLGTLGVPEAGPVLTILLRHPSRSVRQTAASALERVADATCLNGLLEALEDPAVNVRFSLVGAVGHAAGNGRSLTDAQRAELLARLERLLVRDADPGVRSRAATVLGECGPPSILPALWRRVLASEDTRVQEKAWVAMIEIIDHSGDLDLLHEWDHTLVEMKQEPRRLQLLNEISARWQKKEETKTVAALVVEMLIQAQLEQGKWAAAFPLIRELLAKPTADADLDKRLGWLLTVGVQALKEGNRAETLHAVQEAQPLLARHNRLAGEFEKLEKMAKQP